MQTPFPKIRTPLKKANQNLIALGHPIQRLPTHTEPSLITNFISKSKNHLSTPKLNALANVESDTPNPSSTNALSVNRKSFDLPSQNGSTRKLMKNKSSQGPLNNYEQLKNPKNIPQRIERGLLDLNKILNEPAINSLNNRTDLEQNQGSGFPIALSKSSKNRRSINLKKKTDVTAELLKSEAEGVEKNLKTEQNDIFRLTLNENFHTGLREYQPYLRYCNRKELDKQIYNAELKNQLKKGCFKLGQAIQIGYEDIVSDERNSKPISAEVISEYSLRMPKYSLSMPKYSLSMPKYSQKNIKGRFKLNDIQESSLNVLHTDTTLLNQSKITRENFHAALLTTGEESSQKISDNSYEYGSLVANKTFEMIFKKTDPLQKYSKHMEFLLALRMRRQLSLQSKDKFLTPSNSLQNRNELRMKKSQSERISQIKKAAKLLENEIAEQSQRMDSLTNYS